MTRATKLLVLAALLSVPVVALATGPGPVPGFNAAATPLVKVNATTVGIRASSAAQSGYMSAVQASDLAYVLAGGVLPTPAASPADPSLYYGGRVYSTGVVATYFSDDFSRADVANISGTAIQVGGVNWQVNNIGAGSSLTETVGVVSHVLQCTANCSGPGGYGDPGIVIDTSRANAAVSATLPTYPLLTFNLFGLRMSPASGSPLAYPSGFYVYNSAHDSANHICIGGFGGGAPGETCGAAFATSASPVVVMASMSGNVITVELSGLSAPTVSVTSAYQNTATIHGVALQHSVVAPGFTSFAVTAPLVAKSMCVQGYHANGIDTDTLCVGEAANSGAGGGEITSTASAPFSVNGSRVLTGISFSATSTTFPATATLGMCSQSTSSAAAAGALVTDGCSLDGTSSLGVGYFNYSCRVTASDVVQVERCCINAALGCASPSGEPTTFTGFTMRR